MRTPPHCSVEGAMGQGVVEGNAGLCCSSFIFVSSLWRTQLLRRPRCAPRPAAFNTPRCPCVRLWREPSSHSCPHTSTCHAACHERTSTAPGGSTGTSGASRSHTNTHVSSSRCPPALRTHLLLPEEASLVTVGHVDIVLSIKQVRFKVQDEFSQQLTAGSLLGRDGPSSCIMCSSLINSSDQCESDFTSFGSSVVTGSRIHSEDTQLIIQNDDIDPQMTL